MPGQPGWLLAIDFVRFRTIPSWGMHSQLASDRPCVRQILPKWFNISAMTLARSPKRVLAERRTSSRSGDGHKGGAWSGGTPTPETGIECCSQSDGSLGAEVEHRPPLGPAPNVREAARRLYLQRWLLEPARQCGCRAPKRKSNSFSGSGYQGQRRYDPVIFSQAICCLLSLHMGGSDRGTFQSQWQPDRRWKRRA